MALGQHSHPGDTAFAAKLMDMYMKHRGARRFRRFAQRDGHQVGVVQTGTAPEIDQ